MMSLNDFRADPFPKQPAFACVRTGLCACVLLPLCLAGQPAPLTADRRAPKAPPTAPPIVVAPPQTEPLRLTPQPAGGTLYSIGEPTDEEQLYLEYINRARANPPAEGAILANTTDPDVLSAYGSFGVDLLLMQSQFAAIAAAPPVAMNAQLMAAARGHSSHMLTHIYQGHYETNGTIILDPGDRITAQGYSWSTYGENVFAFSESVFHGHAGFEVDWGYYGSGGMQNPPGHRTTIHSSAFREVGLGVVNGTNGVPPNDVGPQLVTQDFATRSGATPLITGVVYYDLDGDGFYSVGEGIGGVRVQVPGSAYFAITANAGGYAVPVTTNGGYAMTFSASGLSTQRVATVASLGNVKVDYVPAYAPPRVAGPNPAALNDNNYFSFTSVGAATNYQWEQTRLVPHTAVEGAENGLANVTVLSSPGYSVIISDLLASGSYAFHLAHPPDPSNPTDQVLTRNVTLLLRTNSQLTFAKRLGWAMPGQVARAQISTNGGAAWQDVWSQPGTGSQGDPSFSRITNSLAAYAGVPARIRFVYDYVSGSFFYQTDSEVGLCLDDIAVSNAEEVQSPLVKDASGSSSLVFFPTNAGDYLLRVRAQLPGRTLLWGPTTRVTVTNLPAMTIQFVGQPARSGNQFQADFNVAHYRSGTPLILLTTSDMGGGWATDPLASVRTVVSNTLFRVTTTNGAGRAFYRVKAN